MSMYSIPSFCILSFARIQNGQPVIENIMTRPFMVDEGVENCRKKDFWQDILKSRVRESCCSPAHKTLTSRRYNLLNTACKEPKSVTTFNLFTFFHADLSNQNSTRSCRLLLIG